MPDENDPVDVDLIDALQDEPVEPEEDDEDEENEPVLSPEEVPEVLE